MWPASVIAITLGCSHRRSLPSSASVSSRSGGSGSCHSRWLQPLPSRSGSCSVIPAWKDRHFPAIVVLLTIALAGLSGAPLLHIRRLTDSSPARAFATAGPIAVLSSPPAWPVMTSIDVSTGNDVPAAGPTVVRLPRANGVAALPGNRERGAAISTISLHLAGFAAINSNGRKWQEIAHIRIVAEDLDPSFCVEGCYRLGDAEASSLKWEHRRGTEGLGAYLLAHQGNAEILVAVRKAESGVWMESLCRLAVPSWTWADIPGWTAFSPWISSEQWLPMARFAMR